MLLLLYSFAAIIATTSSLSAQPDHRDGALATDSTSQARIDSTVTTPPSYAYTFIGGGAIGSRVEVDGYFGSLSRHFSTATVGTSRLSPFATIGLVMSPQLLANAAIGMELLRDRFSIGVSGGIVFAYPSPIPRPYLDGLIGYEIPVADRLGVRLQGGPIFFLNGFTPMLLRADLGIVVR